jgi:hypothetical protein
MAFYDSSRLRHYLGVRNRTMTLDIVVRCQRITHVLFGRLQAIAQNITQHGLRRTASTLRKFGNAALLRRRQY